MDEKKEAGSSLRVIDNKLQLKLKAIWPLIEFPGKVIIS